MLSPSRFLQELPDNLYNDLRIQTVLLLVVMCAYLWSRLTCEE